MKTLRMLGAYCFCIWALVLGTGLEPLLAGQTDSAQVKRLFQSPPREYSTAPLWVWNDLLTQDEIRASLRDLARQQVKQVFVHPRPGLMTPYLSTDWFRLWKVALKEAKRLDMNVWIYDENSYPSGFAGGLVAEAMPESRGRGVGFVVTNNLPSCATNLLKVYRLGTNTAEDVTLNLRAGEQLLGTNFLVVSEVRSTNAAWNANRPYVNLLSPGVTEKFLELTMEPYRREIGREFGHRVPGVFTDEPNIRPSDGWPWSEILLREFRKRWGYDLLDHLASLNQPVGDWRRVRYHYFQLLNEQFIEHWSKPYHDYCARYGLQWTGHYWDHDWPRCLGVPDNMAMYGWHQTPAIDCLMNQYEERVDSQFGNVRIVKELSSVANQLGMKRTLCETYGAGGWDLRFEDMKRIGDWLEVLGVNFIDQHLTYVTIRGARKRDHPQSFSYHEPWWQAYHLSAEYLARISAALAQGEQVNSVLLLEPTTTAWMYQGDDSRLKELGKAFFSLVMSLESNQVEYDLGSEDILARHGSAGPDGLQIGRRLYSTVVLPPFMETINSKTAKLLEQFLAGGGRVLSCGPGPVRVDGTVSEVGSALAMSAHWKSIGPLEIAENLSPAGFIVRRQAQDKGILFHHRRQLKDGQLLFLVNSSLESCSTGTIHTCLAGVERWDPYTSRIEAYPFTKDRQGVTADFKLEPSGSLLLFFSDKELKAAPIKPQVLTSIQPQDSPTIHRLTENVLPLDYLDVTIRGEIRTNLYCYAANKLIWNKHGLDSNPWDSAVQFGDELLTKKFSPGSGFEATYRFRIDTAVPKNLAIAIERPDLYAITCNGRRVVATAGQWWLDKTFGRINIASSARVGENAVTITASPMTIYHEVETVYVLGSFDLRSAEQGFVIQPERALTMSDSGLGRTNQGWNAQGQPFYGGGVSYREHFLVKERTGRFAVSLPKWYGSVAGVSVNGKFAGYIDAPPWESDVTRYIRTGENTVTIVVTGTLKNTLGPHHGNPALGSAWPKRFQVGPETGLPPGTNYSTVAYGLFQPFVLRQTTPALFTSVPR